MNKLIKRLQWFLLMVRQAFAIFGVNLNHRNKYITTENTEGSEKVEPDKLLYREGSFAIRDAIFEV